MENGEPPAKRRQTIPARKEAAVSMSPASAPSAPSRTHASPRDRLDTNRLDIHSHTRIPPSSSQLFDRLPSAADLDQVVLENSDEDFIGVGSDDDLAINDLPLRGDMDLAVHFFLTQINTAFPIVYEPTLHHQVSRLYEGRGSQGDAFTAYSEFWAIRY